MRSLFFMIGAVLVGVGAWFCWEVGTRILAAFDALPWLFPAAVILTVGAVVFTVVYVAVSGSVAVGRAVNLKSRQVHPHDGLYPQVYHRQAGQATYLDLNAPNTQALAVMHRHRGARATSAAVGRVLDWQPVPALPAPEVEVLPAPPLQPLSAVEVVDSDPRTAPHWLLIGASGSGKSNASYAILGELARRNPCEFVIAEPGGVGWGSQAAAVETVEIARTIGDVAGELERRNAMLRAAGVDHVRDLPEPLPYLILVCEETETILDDLRLQDRDLRNQTVVNLRAIARLGRKAGVILVAITQSGTTDVFDAHVRKNLANILIFRSEHTVAETWRLAGVKLTDVAPGWCYSVRHGAMVNFPQVARPALPLLPAPQPLQPLVENDPILVHNWPTQAPVVPVEAGCDPVVTRLDRGRQPDPATAEQLRRLYADGWSKTRLCMATWGYKDGNVWSYLEQALGGEL